jgi:hypothetical protein
VHTPRKLDEAFKGSDKPETVAGGKIMPQLWHTGMARKMIDFPDSGANPV